MSRRRLQPEVMAAPTAPMHGSDSGFTLIELMICITIIVIIAAVAIPNLVRARMVSNEGAAVSNIRTITTVEQQYQTAAILAFPSGMGQYGTLPQLAATAPSFIDEPLGLGRRQGFLYLVVPGGVDGAPIFACNADPIVMDGTGSKGFFADESGVIRSAAGGVAGPGDLPVQ